MSQIQQFRNSQADPFPQQKALKTAAKQINLLPSYRLSSKGGAA